MKNFFFWSSTQIWRKFAHFLRWRPEFVDLRVFLEMKTFFSPKFRRSLQWTPFFLVHTLEFKEIKFSCFPKFVYAPPPSSHAILALTWLHLRATQLLSKKRCRSGDSVTLCPIWLARDLNFRLPPPETNVLPLQDCKSGWAFWVEFGFRPGLGLNLTKTSGLIRAWDVLFALGAQKYN